MLDIDTQKIEAAIPVMREALANAREDGYVGVGLISVADALGEQLGLSPAETDIARSLAGKR